MHTKIFLILYLPILISCSNSKNSTKSQSSEVGKRTKSSTAIIEDKPQHSSKFIAKFTDIANELISSHKYVSFDELQQQKLRNIEENSNIKVSREVPPKMSGNELYFFLKERTLVVGSAHKGQYDSNYLTTATAFVINDDGIIATNYHVIEVNKKLNTLAIFVSDKDGNVYPVTEVLSSSQENDLAILRVNTKGKKLKSIPFAEQELMGEDIFMMGHPFKNTYFMSKGIVARKYISERNGAPRLGVTVDYGQGASGGPIVNVNGQIVAMVSSTYIQMADGNGPVQMVIKEAIPVSTFGEYVK